MVVLIREVESDVNGKDPVAELVSDGRLLPELDDARLVLSIEDTRESEVVDEVTSVVVEDSSVLACDTDTEVEGDVLDDADVLVVDDPA